MLSSLASSSVYAAASVIPAAQVRHDPKVRAVGKAFRAGHDDCRFDNRIEPLFESELAQGDGGVPVVVSVHIKLGGATAEVQSPTAGGYIPNGYDVGTVLKDIKLTIRESLHQKIAISGAAADVKFKWVIHSVIGNSVRSAGPAPSVDCWVRHNSTAIIVEEAAPTRAIRIEGNVRNSMGIVAKHVVPQHSASSMSPGTLHVRVSSTSDTKAAKEAVAARKLFAAWVWLDALVAVFRRLALGEAIFEADLVLQQTRKRRRGRRHNRGVINET